MNKRILIVLLFLLVVSNVMAQGLTRIKDLRGNLNKFRNEVITVEGFVTQYVDASAKTTAKYYLKGDWGQIITVRTAKEAPVVGERYTVKGIVDFDAAFNEPFITEMARTSAEPVQSAGTVTEVKEEVPAGEGRLLIFILAGVAVLVLSILIFILFGMKKKNEGTATYVTPVPGASDMPEPDKVIEGATIKMSAPPEGTLKILPGKLSVVSGDDTVKEIRFYKIPQKDRVVLTFGRGSGDLYSHIQLKPMTVSSKQAQIEYKDNTHVLTNFSTTNPTSVNSKRIGADESLILSSGDKIEMGEVIFEFSDN